MTDTTRELAFGCENMGLSREETIERIAKAAKDLELVDYLNRSIFALSSGENSRLPLAQFTLSHPRSTFSMSHPQIWIMRRLNGWLKSWEN